MFRIFI